MSNDRAHAVGILNKAASLVGHERAGHGSVEESFTMIAEMWSTHINHAMARATGLGMPVPPVHLSARDVLHMMADVKRARAMYGDSANLDNYIDGAGYISLAGMLSANEEPRRELPSSDVAESIPEFLRKKQEESNV